MITLVVAYDFGSHGLAITIECKNKDEPLALLLIHVLRLTERMTPEALLDKVSDRDSFINFVTSLAAEREQAEQMERDEPVRYRFGGAHRWQNGDISSFLYASLSYFDPKPFHKPETAPSWRMLADFLYHGKIIE